MKNKFNVLISGLALLCATGLHAQTPGSSCGTPAALLKEMEPVADRSLSSGPYVFQIYVHILRDNNGANAAMTEAVLYSNLKTMSAFFQPHNICFVLVGLEYIDNTIWNSSYNSNQIDALHAVNPHSDAIDIYVHRLDFMVGNNVAGGNAYAIPSPRYSVSAQSSFNFSHEMGHCLGLAHTFEVNEGVECPDGSNCTSAGDKVCDTPADFNGSQSMSSGCIYTGTQTIFCNGKVLTYNPPTDNIMSYWKNCYAGFTAGQRERMQNTINDTDFLQERLAPMDRTIANTVMDGQMAFGAWQNITLSNVLMAGNAYGVYSAGSLVRLLPGTRIAPTGQDSIIFVINDLCSGVTVDAAADSERNEETNDSTAGRPAPLSAGSINVSPNPFSGSTTVSYHLPSARQISLRIISPDGTIAAQPFQEEEQEPGLHQYGFHAEGLPAGVYFLVLYTGEEAICKRLVLLR